MLFSLNLLGVALGLLLIFTPSNAREYSEIICLCFAFSSCSLLALKHFYPTILAKTDTRSNKIVVPLR
ncbi:hypothetical protein C942_00742 [Photobacterium marinum]|uniref:Uncharacterized protein n=2 Tax=Photobacterium marinum TaxID=1056511 RepID=L8JDR4_9GAMM|nr:hypothetical protein C942_00742 [Photobacterium marinum]